MLGIVARISQFTEILRCYEEDAGLRGIAFSCAIGISNLQSGKHNLLKTLKGLINKILANHS